MPVEGSQKLDGIKTLFFVTAVKEKEKREEVVYVVLYYKPVPRLQTENCFSSNLFSSKLKQYYSQSSKEATVHKTLSASPETEKEQISFFLNPL